MGGAVTLAVNSGVTADGSDVGQWPSAATGVGTGGELQPAKILVKINREVHQKAE